MNEKNFIHKDCTSTEPPKSSHDRTLKGVRDFAEDVRVVSAKTTLINKKWFQNDGTEHLLIKASSG